MEPHLYIAATLLSLNAFYMTKSVCWELYLNSRVGRDPALVSLFEARPKETEIAKKEVLKKFFTLALGGVSRQSSFTAREWRYDKEREGDPGEIENGRDTVVRS